MSSLEALILGLIQGLTEFLPISSSGHLVLGKHLLGIETGGATVEVFLHTGTLLAIVLVFRAKIGKILLSVFRGGRLRARREGVRFTDPHLRLLLLIFLGSIPAGIVWLLFGRQIEALFNSVVFASSALILTGLFLFSTRFSSPRRRELAVSDSILVGFAQGVSLLPGISRSGATIGAGLLSGVQRETAVEYSFLLAVPAILAATGLELRQVLCHQGWSGEPFPLVVGAVSAFVFGYLALVALLGIVRRGRLSVFSYYCWAVGTLGLILAFV